LNFVSQAFEEGSMFFFRNVANRVPSDAASYPRSIKKPPVKTSKLARK